MRQVRVALVQMRSTRSVEQNLADAERLIRAAAETGARYVQTPENTNILEFDRERLRAAVTAEERDPTLARLRAVAREFAITIHIGSLAVVGDGERTANRAFVIGPDGSVRARYDKLHMFDVDLPNGETYRESAKVRPGATAVAVDLPFGRLGLSICYDLRFPQLYRALAKAGVTLLSVPAAFTVPTGEAHWHVLLRARAIENGAFVLAAAQGGLHETGRATYGHSLIVDPWGRVLAEGGTEPGVITADIDLDAVEEARRRIPALTHDRAFTVDVAGDLATEVAS